MKRALLIAALSFGTVAGWASGIHHLRHGAGCDWHHCPCEKSAPQAPAPPATPPEQR